MQPPPDLQRIQQIFHLTALQAEAAFSRGEDLAVTAGAGCGKTLTLAARYLSLLLEGESPSCVIAVTFTDKAAREMRNRVRRGLAQLSADPQLSHPARQRCLELNAQIDSARIGTIHSLCKEILQSHLAEARLDPRFDVAAEGSMGVLKTRAVELGLAAACSPERRAEMGPLFSVLTIDQLKSLLKNLLEKRLEAAAAFSAKDAWQVALNQALGRFLESDSFRSMAEDLQQLIEAKAVRKANSKSAADLEGQACSLAVCWSNARAAYDDGLSIQTAAWLCVSNAFAGRRFYAAMSEGFNDLLKDYKDLYDGQLESLLGRPTRDEQAGEDSRAEVLFQNVAARFQSEAGSYHQILSRLETVYGWTLDAYRSALRERNAVDFDDLEEGAVRLLEKDEVKGFWQGQVSAVLVDEFQDTNERQRKIVEALCGSQPGRLFVVGDARQSIYRFRGADVAVFRGLEADIAGKRNGRRINLDEAFRTHAGLLAGMDDLLAPVMGVEDAPGDLHCVPYTLLKPVFRAPQCPAGCPFIEILLSREGAKSEYAVEGDEKDPADAASDDEPASSEDLRQLAAEALARRLLELKQRANPGGAPQIRRWKDIALLFRASNGFSAYEQAFRLAGIPYITIAGLGFYDRPEIRDLLNILRALLYPWDDAAFAGMLRSPVFGLGDLALYRLRQAQKNAGAPLTLKETLEQYLHQLDEPDCSRARRALAVLAELEPQAAQFPVGDLLHKLVELTDLRALLASVDPQMERNLDKLLSDIQANGLVDPADTLAYVDDLKKAGAREGEAPAEIDEAGEDQPDEEGAVRLMTIHKAKGLGFPVVVLADVGRQFRNAAQDLYLFPETGVAFKLDRSRAEPLPYRLAKTLDKTRESAEYNRLLYVALTRAREKLLISGHLGKGKGESFWTRLAAGIGSEQMDIYLEKAGELQILELPCAFNFSGGHAQPCRVEIGVKIVDSEPAGEKLAWTPLKRSAPAGEQGVPLYSPLPLLVDPVENGAETDRVEEDGTAIVRRWKSERIGAVTGSLVHRAIQRWLFPGSPSLRPLMESMVLKEGLVQPDLKEKAFRRAELLLQRLREHPFWQELDEAGRWHEVPYVAAGIAGERVIDLIYCKDSRWVIVDFKTDQLDTDRAAEKRLKKYRQQVDAYCQAVTAITGQIPERRICYLDDSGRVRIDIW